jgi:two-component system, NarL family, invasion response regulator UvrY
MIRVLLVDDHALFRQGVRGLLSKAPDIQVVAEAAGYAQAIDELRTSDIHVVLTDLSMPGRDGIDLISQVREVRPTVQVLVVSMHEDGEHAARALRSGAIGYVTKGSTADDLVSAVRRVACGRSYVSAAVSENLMQRFTHNEASSQPHATLSQREYRIFEMLIHCKTTTTIAHELSLSVKTVSTHKGRLLKKMGLTHQGELVRYAIEHSLL